MFSKIDNFFEQIFGKNEDLRLLIFTWISAFAIYAGYIIDYLPNPDATCYGMYYNASYSWEMQLGRWMLRYWQYIFGNNISITFTPIISIIVLGICVFLLIDILEVKGFVLRYIAAMLFIVSPHVQSLMSYYYCEAYYMFAFLFMCIALKLLVKEGEDYVKRTIISVVLICLSIGTYQAYMGIIVTAGLMHVIIKCFKADDKKKIFNKCVRLIMSFLLGVISYLICNKILLYLAGKSNTAARGFSEMGHVDIAALIERIPYVIKNYVKYFISDDIMNLSYGIIPRRYINILFIVLGIIILILVIALSYNKDKFMCALGTVFCAFIPFASMIIFIVAPKVYISESTGSLMIPAMNMNYMFIIALVSLLFENVNDSKLLKKRLKNTFMYGSFASAILVIIMFMGMAFDGQAYMKYCMSRFDKAATNISYEIVSRRDGSTEYEFCVIGNMDDGYYWNVYDDLRSSVQWTVQSYGTFWNSYAIDQSIWAKYIRDNVGFGITPCEESEYKEIISTDEFKNMSSYPREGSIEMFDNVIVIKISD